MIEQQRGDIRIVIREKILAGKLPKDAPIKFWAGYGTGKKCDACELPTSTAGIEYEVDIADDRTFLFHQNCLTAWHQERAAFLVDGSR
jgi:hypothetical protein